MKSHAQAILLFTGYPLEPIVAFQIKKSYQTSLPLACSKGAASLQNVPFAYQAEDADVHWFSSYE